MQRMTFGGLELSVIDPHERDTKYIYDEIFVSQIYYHPEMRIPKHPIIMDVGSNIGLYGIWAHRRYQPKEMYCYEASPRTFPYLEANVKRLVDPQTTKVHVFQPRTGEFERPDAHAASVAAGIRNKHAARQE